MAIERFELIRGHDEHPAGTVVTRLVSPDYGLANDDTRSTGVEHISVTLKSDGTYPGFTVPVHKLEKIKQAVNA